jgi:ABC-type branched-subunit amino acid transport system substrate-binding protein
METILLLILTNLFLPARPGAHDMPAHPPPEDMVVQEPRQRNQQPGTTVRIAFIAPPGLHDAAQSAQLGARLGAEEAAHVAALVGGEFELLLRAPASPAHLPELVRELVENDAVTAILGGFDHPTCLALAELAERHGTLFLNLGCPADLLRNESCRRHAFHIEASDAMRDAAATWPAGGPVPTAASSTTTHIALWHPDLSRYGAAQLNERFVDHFARPMDSAAWAGWFAVKVVWETALRAGGTDAEVLIGALEGGLARFDGHKGRPLSFRSWDHQLRQPLYLVGEPGTTKGSASASIAEVPAALPGEEIGAIELLDRLGTPRESSRCHLGR